MRRKDMLIFWPQYFDKNRPVRLGRKVPVGLATAEPTPQDIYKAAIKLGYQAEVEPLPKYPATWWDEPGRVVVESKGQKKLFILRRIAPEIQLIAQQRATKAKSDEISKRDKKKKNIETLKKKIIEKTAK
jgi:signal recognition particle subunit SRP19